MLEIQSISKHFGGNQALKDVSFKLKPAKITAIIGPNGSGKSTLFNIITRVLKQDSGKILLKGQEVSNLEDYSIADKLISRTFQETRAFDYLSIKSHISAALNKDDCSFFKSFFSPRHFDDAIVQKALDSVGLEKDLHTLSCDLSYGQTKLLTLAMAVAKQHDILLLDEPVAGVTPLLRKKIADTLLKLRSNGETILLIEHDMNFVVRLADEIIVMDAGEIVASGTANEIVNNKEVLSCYLGR